MSTIKFWQSGRKIVAVGRNFANHAKGNTSLILKTRYTLHYIELYLKSILF